MKTEFTDKEMFNAYSEAIAEYMKEEMKLNSPTVQRIFQKEEFEKKFLENWKDYEFLEPSKVAKQMVLKNRDAIKVKVVKVRVSNGEVIAVVPENRLSKDHARKVSTALGKSGRRKQRIRSRNLREVKIDENRLLSSNSDRLV